MKSRDGLITFKLKLIDFIKTLDENYHKLTLCRNNKIEFTALFRF